MFFAFHLMSDRYIGFCKSHSESVLFIFCGPHLIMREIPNTITAALLEFESHIIKWQYPNIVTLCLHHIIAICRAASSFLANT